MQVFKKHVSRRTVLKGVGASIALPLLDAMNPAATAWAQTPAGSAPKRFAFIGFPHGAIMDRWSPPQTGTNYEMSPILQPLEAFRQHMTIVSGLRNKPGETPEPHGYIEATWLSCVKPWEHGELMQTVRNALAEAISSARHEGSIDLSGRFASPEAHQHRSASLHVRERLAKEWSG